jgi:hypothetical protein
MGFEHITLLVIGTDCIGSCNSNYHRSVFSGFCHDITEILLKVALNTINQPKPPKMHRGLSFYRIIRDKVGA